VPAAPEAAALPGDALAQSGLKLETALRSTRTETGAGQAPAATVAADVKPEIKPLAAGVSAAFVPAKPEAVAAPGAARSEAIDLSALREAAAPAAAVQQAQPAALQSAQAAGVAAADRIPARVGTPGWDNQVTQKVIFMAAGGEQSASLTLNPPELGPMQVVLSISNDTTNVTFSAAQPEVRQALESALPKLREMMSESGISLGNATVNAGMPEQSQAQAQADGRAGHGQGGGQGQGRAGHQGAGAELPAARPARRSENGLVDTFA
jgi:flagellar hook-length control protein FliK